MRIETLRVARLALSTALVLTATAIVNVYVPATRGYFNLGETVIYLTALLFDPLTAAFAGGVGSALADVILGYSIYAPATLLIKSAEGAAASFLVRKFRKWKASQKVVFALSLITVALYFMILLAIGYTLFVGEVEFSFTELATLKGFLTPSSWMLLAILATATPFYHLIRQRGEIGLIIVALLLAGGIMISGYFLYEQAVLGYYALAEVPVNFGQVILGIAVAIPIYSILKRYQKTSENS